MRIIERFKNQRKYLFLSAFFILFLIVSLFSLFRSGFYDDDSSNSLIWAFFKLHDFSFFDRFHYCFIRSECNGRFYPLYGYAYVLFNLLHDASWIRDVFLYKCFILGSIGINLGLFFYFIQRITKNTALAGSITVMVPVFFQFRIFYDPILSFQALVQTVFSLTLFSLISLDWFLEKHHKKDLIISCLCYAVSLLLYEITYAFFIVYLLLLVYRLKRIRSIVNPSLYYILPLVLAVVGSVIARVLDPVYIRKDYRVHFEISKYFLTAFKHVYAALPLSYFFSNPAMVFDKRVSYLYQNIVPLDLICVGMFLFLFFQFSSWIKSKISPKGLFVFGVPFLILPGLMIALSPVYQYLIEFGLAHLPVYIQYYGACLCIMGLFLLMMNRMASSQIKKVIHIIFGIFLGLVLLINLQNNRLIVEKRNASGVNSWNLHNVLFLAKSSGLFKSSSENAVWISGNYDFNTYDFLTYALFERKEALLNLRDIIPEYQKQMGLTRMPHEGEAEKKLLSGGSTKMVKFWADSVDSGYVAVIELSNLRIDQNLRKAYVKARSIDLYVLEKSHLDLSLEYSSLQFKNGVRTVSETIKRNHIPLSSFSVGKNRFQVPIEVSAGHWMDVSTLQIRSGKP